MKKYIQPSTEMIALGAERLCDELASSIIGSDPAQGMSPLRNFEGGIQSLKYLI